MVSIRIAVIIACVFLILFLDWLLIRWLKKLEMRKKIKDLIGKGWNDMKDPHTIKQEPGPLPFFIEESGEKSHPGIKQSVHKLLPNQHLIKYALELLPLIILTFIMAAPYLDFRQNYYPNGYEYYAVTVTHYVWNLLPKCGTCVFWNGLLNGGMPAFAELLGAVLHPLVIITTLIWGVINGSKIIIIASLLMSGFSMWWFAKELEVGRLSRIWISLFGVVGGHLIGRLESGNILFTLSIASASLLFPMVLRLNKHPTNRRIALLAVLMALTWLSGEGYIQLVVVLGWFPAFLWLLYESGKKKQEKWIAFCKSLFISGLLCGILIIPAAHFMHDMDKDDCPDLHDVQPIRYLPLNLVIGDSALMGQTYLGMDTFPYAHINFIDWTPVILAVIAGYFVFQRKNKKVYGAIYLSILLVMVFCSKEIYLFLVPYFPFLTKICSMGGSSSLMVPPILAMAAWGLDRLFDLKWPNITLGDGQKDEKTKSVSIKWLILIPVLVLSFKNIIPFAKNYLNVHKVEIPAEELAFARVNDAQWVDPPAEWLPTLLDEDRKIIMWDRHVTWKDRQRLAGYIGFTNNPDSGVQIVAQEPDFYVIKRPEELYASVKTDNKYLIKCEAVSLGGDIDVTCNTPSKGILTVLDYQYSGWYAWVDGQPQPLLGGDWLSVNAPSGKHTYTFRYRPWDIYLGAFLTLIGFGVVIWLLWRKKDDRSEQIVGT
jgi:hypothetical protein